MNQSIETTSESRTQFWRKAWRQGLLVAAVSICLVVVVCLFWPAGRRTANGSIELSEAPASAVVLQQVGVMPLISQQDAAMPLRYTATVVARRRTQLAFQATERVDQLLVDEGDTVDAGQLLARQDDTVISAEHQSAVASMKQADAVLQELKQGPRPETIAAARAELEQLKAQAGLASMTLRRQTQLQNANAGSRQEMDTASSNRNATRAAVQSAQQRLQELEAGTREEKIDAQQATFEMAKSRVQQTQARLDQTRLVAPFAGSIARRFIDEGSLPQPGSPAFEIVEVGHLEVRFGVSPKVAKQLKVDQALPFSLGNESFTATVRKIQPTLDRSTRTQEVIADVDADDTQWLVDGQTVRIEFAVPATEPGWWLPTESLQRQVRGLWSVLVLEANNVGESATGAAVDKTSPIGTVAVRRDVELLATWGQWSRVRGTLDASDQVIVAGSSRVSAGQHVDASAIKIAPPWEKNTVKLSGRSHP